MISETQYDRSQFVQYERTACRACGNAIMDLPSVIDMGNPCLSDFLDTRLAPVTPFPQQLVLCEVCGLLQLRHTAPPDKLYRQFWYRSSVTQTMTAELENVAKAATSWCHWKGLHMRFVVDIGANDGTLLGFFPKETCRVGFEPATNLYKEAQGKATIIIPEYFEKKYLPSFYHHSVSVITACAMFYDLDRPNQFLRDVAYLLEPRGLFLVQMNYLGDLTIDNISHEHLCYYSLTTMEKLLNPHGLRTIRVERNGVNGGSLRLYISNFGEADGSVKELLAEEDGKFTVDYFQRFARQSKENGERLYNYLWQRKNEGKRLFLCGASTRGNTTLQYYCLGDGLFEGAGERDERKWGRYTVGTMIPIMGESLARKAADIMLVLPWHFAPEIIGREKWFLEGGGELVFPLPTAARVIGTLRGGIHTEVL